MPSRSAPSRPTAEAPGTARTPRAGAKRGRAQRPLLVLWGKVALLVSLVLVGIPIVHGLAGEVVALLGAAILFGFLLGRWTAPRR